ADTFAPLFAGAATADQAEAVRQTLPRLERRGGLMASELVGSPHQWDGTNGWAPLQAMAIEGLMRYGYVDDARRLADKWVRAVASTYADGGSMYERLDVETLKRPPDDPHKYATQEGFLWTNGSFAWAMVDVLGHALVPRVGEANNDSVRHRASPSRAQGAGSSSSMTPQIPMR
ncbi:MAG TPA: trehalase family glycosidase, partial [Myxococcota bacterium]|nr:trehalase family glycosidase [Myxococcota bacterium]